MALHSPTFETLAGINTVALPSVVFAGIRKHNPAKARFWKRLSCITEATMLESISFIICSQYAIGIFLCCFYCCFTLRIGERVNFLSIGLFSPCGLIKIEIILKPQPVLS